MSKPSVEFPFAIVDVEAEVNAELLNYFNGERTGFVQVGPEKYFFPYKYKVHAAAYYNFQARPDDVWVVSFPRSGTTWTQEMVWLVANNLDFDAAKERLLTERFPFFEFPLFVHPQIKEELLSENANDDIKVEFIDKISVPGYEALSTIDPSCRRFIKTHFPFSLLPPSVMAQKCKIIYVARNPKDVAVSYYHLNRLYRTQGYVGDFERYWNYFIRGLNPWMPYCSHIKEGLEHRHLSNVLYLQYEDMARDLSGAIRKVAQFLDCKVSAEGVENLENHLSIDNFRLNASINGDEMKAVGVLNPGEAEFVRAGGNRSHIEFDKNPTLLNDVKEWMRENHVDFLNNGNRF